MSKPGGRGGRKKFGHKGAAKHFSNETELRAQAEEVRKLKLQGDDSDTETKEEATKDTKPKKADGAESTDESSDEESDDQGKGKGLSNLIEIENPNRVKQKEQKLSNLDFEANDAQLSRREREAAEKERARAEYLRLHAEGKTDEARADLARLAIIRKQREEAALKRDTEKKAREQQEAERKTRDEERRKQLEEKATTKKKGKR